MLNKSILDKLQANLAAKKVATVTARPVQATPVKSVLATAKTLVQNKAVSFSAAAPISSGIFSKVQELQSKLATGSLAPTQSSLVSQMQQKVVELANRESQVSATTNPILKKVLSEQVEKQAVELNQNYWDCLSCKTPATTAQTTSASATATATVPPVQATQPVTLIQPQAKTASGGSMMLLFGAMALGGWLIFGSKDDKKKEPLDGPPAKKTSKTLKSSI